MANYFVSNVRGNDSTGTGTATAPWATIGKAIGASPAITLSGTGDTLYIEPGVYREVFSLGLSPTSGGPLTIAGDGDGAGFRAGGYATPATGLIDWRGWSDDVTGITTQSTFAANGKSYVTLKGLKITGSNVATAQPACLYLLGSWSNWTIQDCGFVGTAVNGVCLWVLGSAGAAMNLTIDRCDFLGTAYGIDFRCQVAASEYALNALVRNCQFYGGIAAVRHVNSGGSGSAFATGLTVQSCTGVANTTFVTVSAANALTTPIGVYGCAAVLCTTGLFATTSGQIVEDGNALICTTPRNANVSAGANSIDKPCPAVSINDERLYGAPVRPFGEPSLVGPLLAFGNYGTPPSVDVYNKTRPGTVAAGALERNVFPDPGPFGGYISCP